PVLIELANEDASIERALGEEIRQRDLAFKSRAAAALVLGEIAASQSLCARHAPHASRGTPHVTASPPPFPGARSRFRHRYARCRRRPAGPGRSPARRSPEVALLERARGARTQRLERRARAVP